MTAQQPTLRLKREVLIKNTKLENTSLITHVNIFDTIYTRHRTTYYCSFCINKMALKSRLQWKKNHKSLSALIMDNIDFPTNPIRLFPNKKIKKAPKIKKLNPFCIQICYCLFEKTCFENSHLINKHELFAIQKYFYVSIDKKWSRAT